jgi:hypothetical protein
MIIKSFVLNFQGGEREEKDCFKLQVAGYGLIELTRFVGFVGLKNRSEDEGKSRNYGEGILNLLRVAGEG